MKKVMHLNQWSSGLCVPFAFFGCMIYNFNRAFSNEQVFEFCKKHGFWKGNRPIDVGKVIAKEFGYKLVEVPIKFLQTYQGRDVACVVSLNTPKSFWIDALDGSLDNYSNEELPDIRHCIYMHSNIIENSFWDKLKPLTIDPKKFRKSWYHLVKGYTLTN